MTPTNIRYCANSLGLTLYTNRPGDGKTRYRFFQGNRASDYHSAGAVFTALGASDATTWLHGYATGREAR